LVHHGVIVPPSPEPTGLELRVRGQWLRPTAKQDEMAQAWARKKDTPYVRDPVFVANFLADFSQELGLDATLGLDELDLSGYYQFVDDDKARKEALGKEERKAQALLRRAEREALKLDYGYAIVNGQRVELGTYMVEPSGIFMGRGQHPLRGRWKEGAAQSDIALNHSPDHSIPPGDWEEVVWQPESLWVARWKDKLSDKLKYIWLGDTAPVKQEREAAKFDKAIELEEQIELVRAHIEQGLLAEDPGRRRVATACYLIDALCLRVGDEKDPDEADTVGATTLRPEHVTIDDDGTLELEFLGKDSVAWHKTLKPPQVVLDNLRELVAGARPSASASDERGHPTRDLPQLFPDVTSRDVNAFLSEVLPSVSAKVFRTHHATLAVQESLAKTKTSAGSAEYLKWRAVSLANYEAALLCNHTKQYNGDWERTKGRYEERQVKAEERLERYQQQVAELAAKLEELKAEAQDKEAAAATPETQEKMRARYRKRLTTARGRIEAARQRQVRAKQSLGKLKAQCQMADKKRTWNLGTSLKSYIDPRVYARWGRQVDYDVLAKYYPTTLRRKFAWVRFAEDDDSDPLASKVEICTCMSLDLERVAPFMAGVQQSLPDLALPTTPDEIAARFLPALSCPWREALMAVDAQDELLAFVGLGPAYECHGGTCLDIVALFASDWNRPALARELAMEITRATQAFESQHPKVDYVLQASDERWQAHAPRLTYLLGLDADDQEQGED
jgi:DNA topoisomerase-1